MTPTHKLQIARVNQKCRLVCIENITHFSAKLGRQGCCAYTSHSFQKAGHFKVYMFIIPAFEFYQNYRKPIQNSTYFC